MSATRENGSRLNPTSTLLWTGHTSAGSAETRDLYHIEVALFVRTLEHRKSVPRCAESLGADFRDAVRGHFLGLAFHSSAPQPNFRWESNCHRRKWKCECAISEDIFALAIGRLNLLVGSFFGGITNPQDGVFAAKQLSEPSSSIQI